jgi:hypothetical protein
MARKLDHRDPQYGGTLLFNFDARFMDTGRVACETFSYHGLQVCPDSYGWSGRLVPGRASVHVLKRYENLSDWMQYWRQLATADGLNFSELHARTMK